MIKQTHIVIDLETMGKGPNAPIAAIGAVCVQNARPIDEFYRRINLESSMQSHLFRELDASTIQWWLQQSAEARAEIDGSQPSNDIYDAIVQLADWMAIYANDREAIVWGNGSSFDNVILRSSIAANYTKLPWQFWNDRDLRTILALYPEAKNVGEFDGIKHHALHDARHEAKQLCKALRLHAGKASGLLDMQTMVSRFLAWPLPASVYADPCAMDPHTRTAAGPTCSPPMKPRRCSSMCWPEVRHD